MGTTLENGVYLPSEGERNCYAGLKTNWEILDQKIADVTALQQAVAGALHRQIVASLPTTDIDPNTIYMILSGTSATENVYNEFMYVNNAWELIGTSATDLTNYYTKAEVDGKLLLKANASDLTSHTGDTTIHVTTADKATWNTVTSKAQDSDVVHKSGNETVGGNKTFTNDVTVNNSNATVQTDVPNLVFKNPLVERASTEGAQTILFTDKNDNNIASIQAKTYALGISDIILTSYSESSDQFVRTTGIVIRRTPTTSKFHPYSDNITTLGESNRRWKQVYALNYYYGNDNVEFSTKFVTTDTAQTISGSKTFSSDLTVANTDTTANTPNLNLRNYKVNRGTNDTGVQTITFFDKNGKALTLIESRKISNGNVGTNILTYNTDDSNNTVSGGVSIIKSKTDTHFAPNADNAVICGRPLAKWSDVQTYKVNALEPSSLSLPSGNASDVIDISSYITDFSGTPNTYTAPANGWVTISINNCMGIQAYISGFLGDSRTRQTAGTIKFLMPICKNQTINLQVYGGSIDNARFIPCQGNV